jgi:hypothetical protein
MLAIAVQQRVRPRQIAGACDVEAPQRADGVSMTHECGKSTDVAVPAERLGGADAVSYAAWADDGVVLHGARWSGTRPVTG